MAIYNWMDLTNGQVVNFVPGSDVININDASISASDMTYGFTNSTDAVNGTFTLSFGGKTVTFGVAVTFPAPLGSITTTNLVFLNGSQALVGDNLSTVTNDNAGNTLNGSANNDVFYGLGGNDTMIGGAGNDSFQTGFSTGSIGNDSIDGGDGFDALIYNPNATAAIQVNLSGVVNSGVAAHTATSTQGTLSLTSIETVLGTSGADLFIGGDPAHDVDSQGNFIVERFRGNNGADTIIGGAGEQFFTIADYANNTNVQAINANLGAGTIVDGRGFTDQVTNVDGVRGGAGNDTMTGGSLSRVTNGSFLETFRGNGGNDTLSGNNAATGGNVGSSDRADYAGNGSTQAVNVDLGLGTAQDGLGGTDTLIDIDQVYGGAGNDTLTGGAGVELFDGNAGNDIINGGGGRDTVSYFLSTAGVIVNFSASSITVGATTVAAGTANDGMGGTDTITNVEIARGSDFNDYLRGSDVVTQREGFNGDGGSDTIDGGAGTEDFALYLSVALVRGGINATLANGSATISDNLGGTDTLTNIEGLGGTNSNDTLNGGAGVQWFIGHGGSDLINGGAENDWVTYFTDPTGVNINLGADTATDGMAGSNGALALGGVDTLTSIENAEGSEFNDTITGGTEGNELRGRAGNDTLSGGDGNDTLIGGLGLDTIDGGNNDDIVFATHDDGNDSIAGGNGFDILDFSQVNGVVQINQLAGTITGSAGNDTLLDVIEQIKGTAFDDVLSGGHGINVLDGEGGNDQFFGNNGDDLMRGGIGNDTFYFSTSDGNDTLLGGDGFDVLDYSSLGGVVQINQLAGTTTGTANNDVLADVFEMVIGTAFGDVLSGGHGGNSLKGNGGDDQFFANNGDDYISGGTGNDTITGGVGSDTQDVRNGENVDTWLDFTAGGTEDTITLTFYSGLGITTFAQLEASGRLSTVSGHAELALNGGDKIIFNNVASHLSLTAADFIF